MATYRILYWQEIPAQIAVADDDSEVNLPLPPAFMEHIDAMAAARGLQESDDYLGQWQWSDEQERPGTAAAVAEELLVELIAKAEW